MAKQQESGGSSGRAALPERVVLGERVVWESEENAGGFLFEPIGGAVYTLNRTGAWLLGRLLDGRTAEAVVGEAVRSFEVNAGDAARDLAGLIRELEEQGLCRVE